MCRRVFQVQSSELTKLYNLKLFVCMDVVVWVEIGWIKHSSYSANIRPEVLCPRCLHSCFVKVKVELRASLSETHVTGIVNTRAQLQLIWRLKTSS